MVQVETAPGVGDGGVDNDVDDDMRRLKSPEDDEQSALDYSSSVNVARIEIRMPFTKWSRFAGRF